MATATPNEHQGVALHPCGTAPREALGIKRPRLAELSGLKDSQLRYLEGVYGGCSSMTSSGDTMLRYSLALLAISIERCMDLTAAWETYNPTALFGLPPHSRMKMMNAARALLKERAA